MAGRSRSVSSVAVLFVRSCSQRTTNRSSCSSTPSFVLSSTFQSPPFPLSTVFRLNVRYPSFVFG